MKNNPVFSLFLIIFALILTPLFIQMSCSDNDDEDPTSTPTPTFTSTPTPEPPTPTPTQAPTHYFFDNFDSYAAGSTIRGQGGWETWGNSTDPASDAQVSSEMSFSQPNSLNISGASDIVHQFSGVASGKWYAKVQVYVPSSQTGNLLFIILNRYAGATNWSAQFSMSAVSGTIASLGGTSNASTATLPLITDQWVPIVVEIDLDANSYTVFYNGTQLDQLPWSVTGILEVQAFDLFSDNSTAAYFDDVYLDTLP